MDTNDSTVDILMSTFNGEAYLKEQIDSIINQTFTDWKLIIRDDDSSDKTINIISEYCIKYPNKIILVDENTENLGYKNSFFRLMDFSTAEYIMFSDQDDYWLPGKIELQMSKMKKTTSNTPTLICSDFAICDEKLSLIKKSYFENINFKIHGQQSILLESRLYGCTFLFNRSLLLLCKKVTDTQKQLSRFKIKGHDNFISVVCAIAGQVEYIDQPLVNHRIHQKSLVGFFDHKKKPTLLQLKILLKYIFNNSAYRKLLFDEKTVEIQEIISAIANNRNITIPYEYIYFMKIENSNYFQRKINNLKFSYKSHPTFLDKIIYILCF